MTGAAQNNNRRQKIGICGSMSNFRMVLSDKAIGRLSAAITGQYKVGDVELKGFYLLVGKRHRTYMVQGDLRQGSRRIASINVSVGDATQMTARDARAVAKSYLGEIGQGQHPKQPEATGAPTDTTPPPSDITLRAAWERYRDAHMIRKKRSETTIAGYRDHIEKIFKDWLDTPLKELGDDPARVAKRHDFITIERGPYRANCAMRTLRALDNHARKTHRSLPADNPVDAVDWNAEERRNTAMGATDLPNWFAQLAKLENPIRREFHLLVLLSGSRPTALKSARPEDFDFKRRTLYIAIAGVSEVDAKLLMNHAIPGVNSGYITRHKLLEDHLRSRQQAISGNIFKAIKD